MSTLNARHVASGSLILALVLVTGFQGHAGPASVKTDNPAVWACGESLKVSPELRPQSRNSVWDAGSRTVRLFGARQEYVGFQVVVRAGSVPLDRVEVRASPLRTSEGVTLDLANADLFRQHYLRVTIPSQYDSDAIMPEATTGEFPVQMVPLRDPVPGRSFPVPSGRNQPVWMDLYIPEDQPPGEYRGEVQVLAGGVPLATLATHLTVWRFTLPRETHLKTYLPTGPEFLRWAFALGPDQQRELRELEDRCFQMAHQHRLNFHPSSNDLEEREWGERYRGYLDGSAFKERAGRGVGQSLLVVGLDSDSPTEIQANVRRVLRWWEREKFPAELVYSVYDEPKGDEQFAAVTRRAQAVRAVAPKLPTLLTTITPNRVPPGLIDIWGEIPAEEIAPRQKAGQRAWAVNFGYAAGPYVDTPGYAGRSQPWMCWKLGLDAWYYWNCCYWADKFNIVDAEGKRYPYSFINRHPERFLIDTWRDPMSCDQKRNPRRKHGMRINGDGVLFYPGRPAGLQEPLASFTMKSLRRGLQDYEYLWLLKERGQSADDLVNRLVPRADEWSRDPDTWDAVRMELGKRLHEGRSPAQ